MSLNHEFILVKSEKDNKSYFDFNDYYSEGEAYVVLDKVSVHDDIIAYLLDSFNWCDSILPDGNKKRDYMGLARFGVTEILNTVKFREIIDNWIRLFSSATETFALTGEFEYPNGDISEGEYNRIEVNQASLISKLTAISNMCRLHSENESGTHFVHLGI